MRRMIQIALAVLVILVVLGIAWGASEALQGITVPVGAESVVVKTSNTIGTVTTAQYSWDGASLVNYCGESDVTATMFKEVGTTDIFVIDISDRTTTSGALAVYFGDSTNQAYVLINVVGIADETLEPEATQEIKEAIRGKYL